MRINKWVICTLLIITFLFTTSLISQNAASTICGDIIESEFLELSQNHQYSINLSAGNMLSVSVIPVGNFLDTHITVFDPIDNNIVETTTETLNTGTVSATGIYTISISNTNGIGVYTLYLGCTLRNGTVIEPGDIDEQSTTIEAPPLIPAFGGYGFPGVQSRDFSGGIELPLQAGQPQTAPVANDVALYTYQATANSTATLSVSRVSGDISIGVTVINQATNEILFIGGMPTSNNLSVELTFPADGTYVIGLFRMDTPTLMDTSGAVQVSIE